MYKTTGDYQEAKSTEVAPIIYAFLTSSRNTRVYSNLEPNDIEINIGISQLCDGTITAGDGTYLGA